MPKMLVVCITSTEKLGSQLAIRDPIRERGDFRTNSLVKQNKLKDGIRLTIKVEEVVVLVDMWSSICSSSYWPNVVLQSSDLLLAPRLASISINV